MKTICSLLICMSIILGSCSAYQTVTLNSFEEYNIPEDERENIHYILKGNKLQYINIESRNNVFLLEPDKTKISESYSYLIQDNIVIPNGSSGVCVGHSNNNLIIDFGKGIIVPLILSKDQNRAQNEISIDEREYSLQLSNRTPGLYFNTREIKR